MTQLASAITESLNLSIGYAKRLLTDIPADKFARFANVNGETITSNHPAFIIGHLSLYAPRIVEQLGGGAATLPEGFATVFSKDATCEDDANGTIYPAMDVVTDTFFSGYDAARDAIQQAGDKLAGPNPMEGRMSELFPTLGSMQNFYVGGHIMMHMGQLSAWRRMMGMGPA